MTWINGGDTLPKSDEAFKEREKAYEKARVIAWEIWFRAYEAGLVTLETLLKNADRSLRKLQIEDHLRWKTLGLLTEHALRIDPPKRLSNKAYRQALQETCVALVRRATDDGYVLSRTSKTGTTAFEHVSHLLENLGISALPRQIEAWYYEHPDKVPE